MREDVRRIVWGGKYWYQLWKEDGVWHGTWVSKHSGMYIRECNAQATRCILAPSYWFLTHGKGYWPDGAAR